jgi:hypothetical protein
MILLGIAAGALGISADQCEDVDLDRLGRRCTEQWRGIQLTKYERQPHTANYCTV